MELRSSASSCCAAHGNRSTSTGDILSAPSAVGALIRWAAERTPSVMGGMVSCWAASLVASNADATCL
eukprot:4864194-Pyramimonas_sp.AAC.1